MNDVRVCQRCGMTVGRQGGAVIFDRKYPCVWGKKGRKKNEK